MADEVEDVSNVQAGDHHKDPIKQKITVRRLIRENPEHGINFQGIGKDVKGLKDWGWKRRRQGRRVTVRDEPKCLKKSLNIMIMVRYI